MHFNLECEIANQKALYLERAGIWDSQALAIPWFLLKDSHEFHWSGTRIVSVPDLTRKP